MEVRQRIEFGEEFSHQDFNLDMLFIFFLFSFRLQQQQQQQQQ